MVGAASNCYCYCAQFTAKPGWKSCGDAGVLQGHGRLWSWDPAASGGTWESSRFLALAGAKNWPRGPEGPSFHGDIEDILHLWSLELVWARVSCRFLGCQLVVSSLILLPVISEVFQKLGPRPTLWAINFFFENFSLSIIRKLSRKVQFEKNMLSDWKVLDEQVSWKSIGTVLRCPSCISLDSVCWTKPVLSRQNAGLKCTNEKTGANYRIWIRSLWHTYLGHGIPSKPSTRFLADSSISFPSSLFVSTQAWGSFPNQLITFKRVKAGKFQTEVMYLHDAGYRCRMTGVEVATCWREAVEQKKRKKLQLPWSRI